MKENMFQKDLGNNTLSIIEDSISPSNQEAKIDESKNVQNSENIPIKLKKSDSFTTLEEFYSEHYPDYKLFKFHGFYYCRIGNLIAFNFNKNNGYLPRFSIGPNWYMTLSLNILITFFAYFLYVFIITKLHILLNLTFVIWVLLVYFWLNAAALIHPEIAMDKVASGRYCFFCEKCKIFHKPEDKVHHCNFCNVCIKRMDHHCVWVGKCVGKNNVKPFYIMTVTVSFFYIYIIICVILFIFKTK